MVQSTRRPRSSKPLSFRILRLPGQRVSDQRRDDCRHLMLTNLSQSLLASLQQSARRIQGEGDSIRVSFVILRPLTAFYVSEEIIDYLTVAIANDKSLKLVDRENLQLIYNEQKLNQEIYIDENQARQLGNSMEQMPFIWEYLQKSGR